MTWSGIVDSIVVERAFNLLMLVCLMLLFFVLCPEAHLVGESALPAIGLSFLALAASITFYGFMWARTHRAIDKVLRVLPQKLWPFIGRRLKL
jgi:hypothetical protein